MRVKLFIFETKAPAWVESVRQEYAAKINPFTPFAIHLLKSPGAERENAALKMKKEAELLLKQISEKEILVLFDEGGKPFPSSEAFAEQMGRLLESGKAQLNFCIGGPFGFDKSVKERSDARWSFSGLTLNHWVAQTVALEQIYRALTIRKGIPYHNR